MGAGNSVSVALKQARPLTIFARQVTKFGFDKRYTSATQVNESKPWKIFSCFRRLLSLCPWPPSFVAL